MKTHIEASVWFVAVAEREWRERDRRKRSLAIKYPGLPAVFRFSVKWRGSVPPLASVPPLRGGDFQGIRVYRSDVFVGRARKANFRAPHRLDEPTKLSLGMVASLQSPLPFHLAKSL